MAIPDTLHRENTRRDRREAVAVASDFSPGSQSPAQIVKTAAPPGFECQLNGGRFRAVPIDQWRRGYHEAKAAGHCSGGMLRLAGQTYVLLRLDHVGATPEAAVLQRLTGRELQIAHKIGAGLSDKCIAFELGISEYTVREHVRRIFHKLKVSKRASLVRVLYDQLRALA